MKRAADQDNLGSKGTRSLFCESGIAAVIRGLPSVQQMSSDPTRVDQSAASKLKPLRHNFGIAGASIKVDV